MKIVNGYFVYCAYITYKQHFNPTNKTNISKYNYNLFGIDFSQYNESKEAKWCDLVAKKTKTEENTINLFISAFVDDPSVYIRDILGNYQHYFGLSVKRRDRIQNIPYSFRADCVYLVGNGLKFDSEMAVFVFKEYMKSKIELETFIIFKKMFNFSLDSSPDFVYIYKVKYFKYELLLNIDVEKYKIILTEVVRNDLNKYPREVIPAL